jgi:hypothetical protein
MKVEVALGLRAGFIAGTCHPLYLRSNMIRLFSFLMIVIAMFVSPLAMANGAGMAMPDAEVTSAAPAGSHCANSETPAEDDHSREGASCASACAAFPAVGPAHPEEVLAASQLVSVGVPLALSGIHPEGQLRPPRIIPEI